MNWKEIILFFCLREKRGLINICERLHIRLKSVKSVINDPRRKRNVNSWFWVRNFDQNTHHTEVYIMCATSVMFIVMLENMIFRIWNASSGIFEEMWKGFCFSLFCLIFYTFIHLLIKFIACLFSCLFVCLFACLFIFLSLCFHD